MNKHLYNMLKQVRQYSSLCSLLLLLALVKAPAHAQQTENILTVPDFEGRIDKIVNVPIYLTNSSEVVAAQFDVVLPFNVPKNATATLTNRANQHSATINAKGGRSFSVVIMSMQNNALRGSSGLLLRLPMQTYDDGNTGKPYPIILSNIVLTDRDGNNIATQSTAEGHFSVSRADLPDLLVTSVTPVTLQPQPNELFNCDFIVKNDGTGNTHAGWTEKVYLESVQTGERTYIGSMHYADSLEAQGEIARTFSAHLPSLVHTDGQQFVYVVVTPDPAAGELTVDQGNNSGRSSETVTLGKKLFASINKQSVSEGRYYNYYSSYRDYITLTISRSGDWSTEESFPLTCSVNGLLSANDAILSSTIPQYVTIPAKSASTTVRIYAVDDDIVRAREADITIGEANSYNSVTLRINRTDNDTDPLSLTTSFTKMTEGKDQQLVITATRGGEMTEALTLNINCTQAARFTPNPIQISISKGKPSGSVTLTLIDDDIPQPDVTTTFTTWASDYQHASASVDIYDDDRPTLTLTLSPSVVRENAGSQATTATIRRDRGYDKDGSITVRLYSSNESNVYFADKIITLGKGEQEKEVKVGVIDNSAVDGERQYQLSAGLYLPTTNTTASIGDRAYATAKLTVTDDESPYLTVTSKNSLVSEGSSFMATITRYVSSTSNAQTINISADNANDVKLPSTVTIPSGSQSANFTVEVNRNEQQDDERMLFINAYAMGLSAGQLSLKITDRTLPDATCTVTGYNGEELFSGMPITLTPEISNVGTAELPADMQIEFFLANSDRLYNYTKTTPIFTARTNTPIGIAESKTFTLKGNMPAVVGTYWLYARVNSDNKINEYSVSNNVSISPVKVTIAAPFSVTELKVEREDYLPGEAVKVTGTVSSKQTNGLKNQYVSITLSGNGQSTMSTTTLVDENTGDFTAYPVLSSSASGNITIKARALGQTEADMTANINVWSLSIATAKTTWTLDENYPKEGVLTIRNNSAKRITGLSVTNSALPFGCELSSLTPSATTLEAGASVQINYRVSGSKGMTSGQYSLFTISATSEQGAKVELPIRYYCRATNCQLAFDSKQLKTTLLLDTKRTIQLKVTNHGLKASGPIDLVVSDDQEWLTCLTASPMASIDPGKSDYISFELKHQKGMHSGQTFPAYIALNPENGASTGGKMEITIVGTEYSTLNIDVEDIYVKARREYQKVSAAQVNITDARTGKSVMTGLTDGAGHWMTDKITAGIYYVTISALRHKTLRKQLVIGPGDEQQMSFFLPYQAVVTDFVASQNITDNSYQLVANINIDSMAPQAIVVPELPENGFECGNLDFNLTLRNVGSFTAQDVQLVFPTIANASFSVGTIGNIVPGGEIVIPVHYEGPESGRRRAIASVLMYYGFSIGGSYYSESDYYQSLVGCMTSEQPLPPIVDPDQPEIPDGGDGDGDDGEDQNEAELEGPSTGTALPTHNSSVTLTFDDITRINVGEPFYATLRIVNGQDDDLRNINFTHMVSDDSEDYETDMGTLFSCEQEDVRGFTGQIGQLSLAKHSEGSLRLRFIPSNNVTTDGKHIYYIGGQLNYIDPVQNFGQAVTLPQLAITVSQKGEASIVYLLQNDFLGNDSTTEQTVTGIPAQHIMLVRNEGQTNITHLSISTDVPEAITNSNNEATTLQLLQASINQVLSNALPLSINHDTLATGSMAIGRWVMQSQNDSHLANTDSLAASVMGAADNELKLTVNGVHKLFRSVRNMYDFNNSVIDPDASEQEKLLAEFNASTVFLLDDEEDEEHLPDNIMFSNGQETGLQVVSEGVTITGSAGEYTLTVNTKQAGWIYLRVSDPTNGFMMLKQVERNNVLMSQANVWITDHTVLNDYSSISEYLLHLADSVEAGTTTYQLSYETLPGKSVRAMSIRLYTADETEVLAKADTKERVTKAVVEFTGNIKYLYKTHLAVFAAEQKQSNDSIDIFPDNGPANVWTIDLSRLDAIPGSHSLTLNVSKLKEPKPSNRACEGQISIEWNEDITSKLPVTIEVATGKESGSINKESGDYSYGLLTLEASPNEGYQFDYWEADGIRLENESQTLEYDVQQAVVLRAFFSKKLYEISIVCNEEEGIVVGASSGSYEWLCPIRLTAIPNDGYEFVNWKWNTDSISTQQLDIVVKEDCIYTAVFCKKTPTQIADLHADRISTDCIYSVNGQLLRRHVNNLKEALRSLPEGLYIIGGKKVLNRKK